MKREQSRAGSRFAECEKSRLKAKILITLALLLTAVTGAWAADGVIMKELTVPSEWNNDNTSLTVDEMTGFKDFSSLTEDEAKALLNSVPAGKVLIIYGAGASSNSFKLVQSNGVQVAVGETPLSHSQLFSLKDQYKYYYTTSDAIEVKPVAGKTNEWTFSMPGSDVVLTPQYAPTAQWATEGDAVLAPTAIEGVIAGTTDAIVKAGTVVEGQGTVMYAVTSTNQATAPELSAFSATLPTAANIADDGATVYVWYYIKGTDTPDGQEATAENTFNDSEICAQPLEVIVLSNKFDLTFDAANANTIEAGKATVKVGETAAEVKEGKLTGVKMGTKVTVTAKQGYKFRDVSVKKAGPAVKTFNCAGVELIYEDGDTWAKVIERNPGKIYDDYGWIGRSDTEFFLIEGEELINGNQIITTDKIVDPTATYSWQAG